ncbi:hypothetical protein SCOCK_300026 [Actinacidiphila cocklensis]|uniref:Uncharacterized protein n=1 Tax=Actinacidiphila cocklensis TaxID=887465 RepID=A0A9W4E838_9ACTN|nr:hypothetical protein SCOCK_300026 [Actinacidiphila cocklensis]
MAQHQQFRLLGHVPAHQHRRDREELAYHPVHQRDDHPDKVPANRDAAPDARARRLPPAAMSFRTAQDFPVKRDELSGHYYHLREKRSQTRTPRGPQTVPDRSRDPPLSAPLFRHRAVGRNTQPRHPFDGTE